MIRHVLTLMWNRRRANALLILEIFLAFLVLFAVGTIGGSLWQNYREPLGFRYDNVWQVSYLPGTQRKAEALGTLQQVLARLRATPGVLGVAVTAANTPFSFNDSRTVIDFADRPGGPKRPIQNINSYAVGPELRDVMGLEVTAGRWFDPRDAVGGLHAPVVIDEQMQRAMFPAGESALGKLLPLNDMLQGRVIGVVRAYRTDGELMGPLPAIFGPISPADTFSLPQSLLLRVQPGSGARLEKRITDDIRRIGPGWTSTVRTLPDMHESQFKQVITKPLLLGVMSVFLLINVALGLFGVLWLAISARRAELGVRRAVGAPTGAIARLIVGEKLALTTFGLVLGAAGGGAISAAGGVWRAHQRVPDGLRPGHRGALLAGSYLRAAPQLAGGGHPAGRGAARGVAWVLLLGGRLRLGSTFRDE
ncbi:ABC transporter permease [Hymenobacter coccineus]|uniref:Uncharacterized protein n=1 Tax=Hymenobacter coccineus TaxID=1908235 RepID=A0A1G1TJ19_9BACT|nr:ABC transporter permease [Hymenobacter coccineus]OGX90875.1 hypothetical protein BEN49_06000 [Hymenobacter coccineus]